MIVVIMYQQRVKQIRQGPANIADWTYDTRGTPAIAVLAIPRQAVPWT